MKRNTKIREELFKEMAKELLKKGASELSPEKRAYIQKMLQEYEKSKPAKRKYSTNWQAYNEAQTKEGIQFMQLLHELINQVEFVPKNSRGRPSADIRDILFSCGMKLYTGLANRRLISQLEVAKELKLLAKVPDFRTIQKYLNKIEVTDILKELLTLSSLSLRSFEDKFAVDATGFSTDKYESWFNAKYKARSKRSKFVKVHAMVGVKTGIITSLEITDGHRNDCPQFVLLVNKTGENFNMSEVSADKAYLSRKNLDTVWKHGGTAYIPFKKGSTGKSRSSDVWKQSFNYFKKHNVEFLEHYHLRSNVESVFSAMKRKFGAKLFTRNFQAQVNELYLKSICYNLCVLIKSMYEHDIEVNIEQCSKIIEKKI